MDEQGGGSGAGHRLDGGGLPQVEPGPAQGGLAQGGEQQPRREGQGGGQLGAELAQDVAHLRLDGGIGAVGDGGLHLVGQRPSGGHQHRGRPHGHAVEEYFRLRVPPENPVHPAHQIQPLVKAPAHVIALALAVAPLVGHQHVPAHIIVVLGNGPHGLIAVVVAVHTHRPAVAALRPGHQGRPEDQAVHGLDGGLLEALPLPGPVPARDLDGVYVVDHLGRSGGRLAVLACDLGGVQVLLLRVPGLGEHHPVVEVIAQGGPAARGPGPCRGEAQQSDRFLFHTEASSHLLFFNILPGQAQRQQGM